MGSYDLSIDYQWILLITVVASGKKSTKWLWLVTDIHASQNIQLEIGLLIFIFCGYMYFDAQGVSHWCLKCKRPCKEYEYEGGQNGKHCILSQDTQLN